MVDYFVDIEKVLECSYREDVGSGDITTNAIVDDKEHGKAIVLAKSEGIVCGTEIFRRAFKRVDETLTVFIFKHDGDYIYKKDEVVAVIDGKLKSILTAERYALNIFQHLSGIATETNKFVKALKGSSIKIIDTRKTLPCLRILEKYAVKVGGGENHRFGLYDAVLIKENHIKVAGSITNAVKRVRNKYGNKYFVEVEVKNCEELSEVLQLDIDRIMLDNFSIKEIEKAVNMIREVSHKHEKKIEIEASGNMTVEKVRQLRDYAIDYISVGSITHSAKSFDYSLLIR